MSWWRPWRREHLEARRRATDAAQARDAARERLAQDPARWTDALTAGRRLATALEASHERRPA